MAFFRTCTGCVLQGKPCEARDTLRKQIANLGVTSIKWKCKERIARIQVGDLVWALTVESQNNNGEYDEPYRDHFPGVVVRDLGSKMLVFIDAGAPSRSDEDIKFEPTGNGFCKIPLSRIERRDGEREVVCKDCNYPASKGHHEGYSCAMTTKDIVE